MRTIRGLATGLLLLALLPVVTSAQEGRLFKDSWFWGAKAGNMTFWTTRVNHAQAPLIGVETLITRSRGGLYISGDMAFFEEESTLGYQASGEPIVVTIKDMRRFTAAAMIFPRAFGAIRPYGGLGFALNFIEDVSVPGATSQIERDIVNEYAADEKSRAAPVFIVGAQLQLLRLSVFGQGTYMPAQANFLLNNNETYFLEAGLRYNVGTSIDRPR